MLTNEDSPDIDESEQKNVRNLVQREDEREDMIGHALSKPVKRVKGMTGVWSRHDPLVVRFMQRPVYTRVVQTSMDPIDEEVGETEEEGELEEIVEPKGCLMGGVIHLGIPSHFANEEGNGEEGHDWESNGGLCDLHSDLILEVFGVGKCGMVENEDV